MLSLGKARAGLVFPEKRGSIEPRIPAFPPNRTADPPVCWVDAGMTQRTQYWFHDHLEIDI
ncbi:MAG: hypothetical protein A3G33_00555 [Omnitrophica bacterium RIFCSPLOWO2_12_FULL_44_17]|uniref:Uncharacterized protein n=1 Tax=Candidatus Danuiimicrobium aquiferis TaxID=1801832 RepID=A0A1G1L106_9BACT|nr:MAG: hypothetical protein A3B72_05545 [Omnitrophica bacterium RIFCSPHIGHO2_02_FULL_45_28]OGW90568.1 MAG: hypothetical protein A3E74_03820 [Omnitrophica bacterium RIFCSPHIGHO2_12_FULL_44_12]OGW98811.1 MAG: hypothetical protein A3G33_00555 [Omnitrophica bacterium RIFCSPLOWO2_12_FULL_44_17]OGX02675.1 MAG: hypothetical protein A3J12_06755 [Omnitrophica bacterium RIFCSPLOWO2_02_FULL_44_11]